MRLDGEVAAAVFADVGGFHAPTEGVREELHAVTDAEDRHPEPQQTLVELRGTGLVDRGRATGEDDRLRRISGELVDPTCAGSSSL